MEKLILVDKNNNEIGFEGKTKIHELGLLHRAFSIFVFNAKKELLLQKRALEKYHSPGLWTNSCCGHPRQNEKIENAVHRRLKEEFGFDCALKKEFHFVYKEKVGKLIEHEFDSVFTGAFDGIPDPDKAEIMDFKWISFDDLQKDIKENPDNYTAWFKIIMALPQIEKLFQVK